MSQTIQLTKIQTRVFVKFTKDEQVTMMLFDGEVRVCYSFLSGSVSVENGDDECLFLTHYGLIDYIQVAAEEPIVPIFLEKDMNVPEDSCFKIFKVLFPKKKSFVKCTYTERLFAYLDYIRSTNTHLTMDCTGMDFDELIIYCVSEEEYASVVDDYKKRVLE